jgi:hypothetical protein
VWEREREAADAIAAQIATAEQLLASPAAHDGEATSSDTVGGVYGVPTALTVGTEPRTIPTVLWHDPTNPLVAQLHLQAGSVQNIRLMVPVILEPESPSYTRWRDLLLLTLCRYALDDHVLCDPTGMAPTAAWVRLDSIVPTWIVGTISVDLHSLLRNLPHARVAWLATEGQFLDKAEARALRLDAAIRIFVQGDLSVSEYCRKMKTMADSLGDLGCPVEDRMLVLNVLRGLSDRYTNLRSLIMRKRPFPTFLLVRDDLALEDITLGAQSASISGPGSSSSSTAVAAITPTRPLTPSQSALGPHQPGPSRAGVEVAEAGAVVAVAAVVVVVLAVVPVATHRRRDPNRVRLGPVSTTCGQGASPCGRSRGQVLRLVPRRPCSLVRRRGSPSPLRRPGPLDACRFVVAHAAGCSTVRAGWLGRDRPGCLPDSHSDSTNGSRVDRGHRCYLPHHSRPWYTHLCSPSFLSHFVHHDGEWLVSSCHICGCRRPSRLFSHSRCSCRSFFGPQSSFYSPFYC